MSARSIKEGRLPHMPTILNYVARRNSPRESVSSLRVCSIPFHLAKKEYSNGCASAETIPMHHFRNKEFVIDFVIGVILLVVSLMVETRAVTYVDNQTSNAVSDIVLNNTRVYNVDGLYVYGAVSLIAFIVFVCVWYPRRLPFVLKSIALFTFVRAFFISLTHIGPYPAQVVISPSFFTTYFPTIFTSNDLFFSGHTGLPFLMALIFWDNKMLRTIFLGFTLLLAVVVLLGHIHYSIDVVSAFFITFGIFSMAKVFFKRDWLRLNRD